MVKSRFEREWADNPAAPVYYLDLIKYRDISNTIADKLSVKHESPQVLVIKNGECVYHASHNAISAGEVLTKL